MDESVIQLANKHMPDMRIMAAGLVYWKSAFQKGLRFLEFFVLGSLFRSNRAKVGIFAVTPSKLVVLKFGKIFDLANFSRESVAAPELTPDLESFALSQHRIEVYQDTDGHQLSIYDMLDDLKMQFTFPSKFDTVRTPIVDEIKQIIDEQRTKLSKGA